MLQKFQVKGWYLRQSRAVYLAVPLRELKAVVHERFGDIGTMQRGECEKRRSTLLKLARGVVELLVRVKGKSQLFVQNVTKAVLFRQRSGPEPAMQDVVDVCVDLDKALVHHRELREYTPLLGAVLEALERSEAVESKKGAAFGVETLTNFEERFRKAILDHALRHNHLGKFLVVCEPDLDELALEPAAFLLVKSHCRKLSDLQLAVDPVRSEGAHSLTQATRKLELKQIRLPRIHAFEKVLEKHIGAVLQ